jgi:hypothetical protein
MLRLGQLARNEPLSLSEREMLRTLRAVQGGRWAGCRGGGQAVSLTALLGQHMGEIVSLGVPLDRAERREVRQALAMLADAPTGVAYLRDNDRRGRFSAQAAERWLERKPKRRFADLIQRTRWPSAMLRSLKANATTLQGVHKALQIIGINVSANHRRRV